MSWAEGRDEGAGGWRIEAVPTPAGRVQVTLFAEDPASGAPVNGLQLRAKLEPLEQPPGAGGAAGPPSPVTLLPEAPGRYRAELPERAEQSVGREGVYRLEVSEAGGTTAERFVTVPYPPEYHRFGVDRTFLKDLAERAGGGSRLLNLPRADLVKWLEEQGSLRAYTSLRPHLLVLAVLFFLCEIAVRGMRLRR